MIDVYLPGSFRGHCHLQYYEGKVEVAKVITGVYIQKWMNKSRKGRQTHPFFWPLMLICFPRGLDGQSSPVMSQANGFSGASMVRWLESMTTNLRT